MWKMCITPCSENYLENYVNASGKEKTDRMAWDTQRKMRKKGRSVELWGRNSGGNLSGSLQLSPGDMQDKRPIARKENRRNTACNQQVNCLYIADNRGRKNSWGRGGKSSAFLQMDGTRGGAALPVQGRC